MIDSHRGDAHVFDSWIVGDSPDSRRTCVVHAVSPRWSNEAGQVDFKAIEAKAARPAMTDERR
jgi:hypothetical protein